jgi:two-component system KDP operon response regulator KdpE
VLVVDDEPSLRQMLVGSLRNAGYVASAVAEGQAALEMIASEAPDLVVLDLFLPGQDGFAVLQQIRDWSNVMVMMLTASSEPAHIVRGLQIGADDYLTKPFRVDEFLARVAALLRRRGGELELDTPVIQRGPLQIDVARREVQVDGKSVDLTPTEFRLLTYLAQHAEQVLTHAQILQHVWGPAYGGESQYLWVHIGRLRQKIEADPRAPRLIVTERGVGYRLAAEQGRPQEHV